MGDHGEQFGADLYRLLQVSNEFLPKLSDIYTEVSQDVARARTSLESVLSRPGYFGGGTYGPLYQPWAALEADATAILGQTITEIDDTAKALNLAITAFEATDSGAASRLRALISQDGDPNPGMVSH